MATAFGGTTFPPWLASDFSCALTGTLAFTVEPGEKATPPKVSEPALAATEPAWSNRINVVTEKNRARLRQTYWESVRIMLLVFRAKNVRNKTSNLI